MKQSKDIGLIHLSNSGYAFLIDSFCITLYRGRITKKGAKQYDALGYYSCLEAMFLRLIDLAGLDGCKDLQDIVDRQNDLKKWLADSLQDLSQNPSLADQVLENQIRVPK